MFFRRMFSRKSNGTSAPLNSNRHNARLPHSPKKLQRRSPSADKRGLSVLQLTPLWEHIIRTRTLPEDLNPGEMFEEFLERLRDPEWQVRQHALRVLVDVLLVIGQKADNYFSPIVPQLVENLGHPAPTVRKGALDCLRVYVSNTAMPEIIIFDILDIGLNQRITNEPFGGRLTCGVMLSLPSLVQSTLHSKKRNYILRTTIDMLVTKMTQVTHQEITLKVLLRIKDLIGPREFAEYMSHGAYREFDLLCNVYGLDNNRTRESNTAAWTLLSSFESDDSEPIWQTLDNGSTLNSPDIGMDEDTQEKVIMETEIKIKDDTLTMRIVETENATGDEGSPAEICSGDDEAEAEEGNNVLENTGILQVLTDSEVDDVNGNVESDFVPRTPKRVTFGGEIVKMRTPDSDTVTHSDVDELSNKSASNFEKLNFLTVEITNDNTKPIVQPQKIRPNHNTLKDNIKYSPASTSPETMSPSSPKIRSTLEQIRAKSASPKSPFRRISISPVDDIISPKPPHKQIEVLHNLQRSPCPSPGVRARRQTSKIDSFDTDDKKTEEKLENNHIPVKSWEDLNLVDQNVLDHLKSGDWRHRSHAISMLEETLRSSENLALVVPSLDSLFRSLLSSERNAEVAEDKRRVVMNLISRIPLDNLESRTNQIITGLCRQGGAGSNLVSKTLMQRMPPSAIVLKLLSDEFLHARSSKFRENALQMVMFALMTFPSTCFDTATCVTRATYAAMDRKRRVRQASLDVLAVLGQVVSPRAVMDIVQNITETREEGNVLCNAVKARLARKQLPIISPDGFVQYALRIPSPPSNDPEFLKDLGSDIEWIASGVGSVSPTSMKRRTQKFQYSSKENSMNGKTFSSMSRNNDEGLRRLKAPHEILGMGVGVKSLDDSGTSDEKGNVQHSLATGVPMQMKFINAGTHSTGDIIGVHGKRIATKSCSDSSQDGRSSDSTAESIRHIRTNVTSRFPAVERLDSTSIFADKQSSYRNIYADFGARRLNETFPKPNYTVHQKRGSQNHYLNETFIESSFEEVPYEVQHLSEGCAPQNTRRFMNVEKFIMQSNKPQQQQLPLHLSSNNIHYNQEENGGQVDECKRVESLSIKSEQHETPVNDRNAKYSNAYIRNGEISDVNGILKTHELSFEDRFSSGNSTPTRIMNEMVISKAINVRDEDELDHSNGHETNANIRSNTEPSVNIDGENENRENDQIQLQLDKVTDEVNKLKENFTKKVDEIVKPVLNDILDDDEASSNKTPDTVIRSKREVSTNKEEDVESSPKIYDFTETNDEKLEIEEHVMNTDPIEIGTLEQVGEDNHSNKSFGTPSKEKEISRIIQKVEEDLKADIISEDHPPLLPQVPSPIPTMEVKPITRKSSAHKSSESLLNKSSESIFEIPVRHEGDSKSVTSTEASSDYQHSHAASLDEPMTTQLPGDFVVVKPQHTPLIRKSKTTLFGNNRRVSPVKQSIKLSKAETFPQTLTKFDRPKEGLNQSITQLDSPNWETVILGLRSIVRLMRYHPEILEVHMHIVCMHLARAAKNLRSQVARAACQASTELFTIRCKHVDQECDDLVGNLLHRTADTNRFLRADATRALESMCDYLAPSKVLHLLTTRGAAHQNALVRTTSAKLLNRLADRLGCDRIFGMNRENRDKFIVTGANLLLEGSLETRSYAKSLFRLLSNHQNYNRLLLEIIPSRTYRNIEKTLRSIK